MGPVPQRWDPEIAFTHDPTVPRSARHIPSANSEHPVRCRRVDYGEDSYTMSGPRIQSRASAPFPHRCVDGASTVHRRCIPPGIILGCTYRGLRALWEARTALPAPFVGCTLGPCLVSDLRPTIHTRTFLTERLDRREALRAAWSKEARLLRWESPRADTPGTTAHTQGTPSRTKSGLLQDNIS